MEAPWLSHRNNEIEQSNASNIDVVPLGWNTVFTPPPPPGLHTKEPHHKEPEVKHEAMVWFDEFIQATQSEKYRDLFVFEECTDQETLKLCKEADFESMGIKKGARLRMLHFLKFGKLRVNKGRPAPRVARNGT